MGPSYMIRITKRVAIAQVAGTWLFSFLMFCPLIIAWDVYVGNSLAEDMVCEAKFMHDSVVVIIHAVVAFIIPFVCMTSVNVFIYVKIKQRLMMKQAGNIPVSTINPDNQTATAAPKPRTDRNENRRHLKAAKFLTMIVAAFWLFWSPMAFTTVLISFWDDCLNQSLYVVFYYLVWVKSSVNPFLYAYNSPRYRMNFQRFLSCNSRHQFRKREQNVESAITVQTSPD
ncbi:muscarinic acetylcholine receptor M5-like [Dreissena polymorpha]|nr:muscarinic acetylcholine receptor M5-like [Dreissena polymorpha]